MSKVKKEFKEIITDKMTHEQFWNWVGSWYSTEEINMATESWFDEGMQETIDDFKAGKFNTVQQKKVMEFMEKFTEYMDAGNKILKRKGWGLFSMMRDTRELKAVRGMMTKHLTATNYVMTELSLNNTLEKLKLTEETVELCKKKDIEQEKIIKYLKEKGIEQEKLIALLEKQTKPKKVGRPKKITSTMRMGTMSEVTRAKKAKKVLHTTVKIVGKVLKD